VVDNVAVGNSIGQSLWQPVMGCLGQPLTSAATKTSKCKGS
jgi:hypothetical protein